MKVVGGVGAGACAHFPCKARGLQDVGGGEGAAIAGGDVGIAKGVVRLVELVHGFGGAELALMVGGVDFM